MQILNRALYRDKFWRWPAIIGLAIVAVALIEGCASAPYWVKTHEPVPHTSTRYVDYPCGMRGINGCANRFTGEIQIRRGMSEAEAWCTREHELKHLAGYSHPGSNYALASDCGNGETL